MSTVLGVVSTTYHLLVFLFLKEAYMQEDDVDLVVTDKTAYMEEIYRSGRLKPYFRRVLFADGRKIKNPYKSAPVTFWESMIHNPTTARIMDGPMDRYDRIFFASTALPDEIVKEIAKTAILQNHKVTFHRFEDGFASYTKFPEHLINTDSGKFLYRKLFGYDIAQKENELYLFEPYLAGDTGDFAKIKIPKDRERISKILTMARDIFQFSCRPLAEEYVFLGQGAANSANNPDTYRSMVLTIADYVGRDNFIIKPHPRGIYDDFSGTLSVYQDNCPFELTQAAGCLEEKTLISFYSTACISGSLLFESNARILFLYPLSGDSFNEKCDYEDYFDKLTQMYPNIHIAHTMEELYALLNKRTDSV